MHRIRLPIGHIIPISLALFALTSTGSAQTRKDFHFSAGAGAIVSILNEFGPVSVQPAQSSQIVVTALINSEKATVEATKKGNRIEFRTRLFGHPQEKDAQVQYQVQVPRDANVTVRSTDGTLRVEGLQGDITIEGEGANVEVANSTSAHVHVHTVTGPVTLTNVKNSYVDVTSVAGSIDMTGVTGPKVGASTGSGSIRFAGDCTGGGTYFFVNHAGDTEVILPTSASVDVSARSLKGRVLSDFPFKSGQGGASSESNPGAPVVDSLTPADDKSLSGTSNSGSSSLRIKSFSGNIKVRKQ